MCINDKIFKRSGGIVFLDLKVSSWVDNFQSFCLPNNSFICQNLWAKRNIDCWVAISKNNIVVDIEKELEVKDLYASSAAKTRISHSLISKSLVFFFDKSKSLVNNA